MGAFAVNLHARIDDTAAVRSCVTDIGATDYYVSKPLRGWVSVYERRLSEQDETWIKQFAGELSGRLGTACVAFLIHDSDIACYWLYDRGRLLDEYNSAPGYFEEASSDEQERVRGKADVFARYCSPGVTTDQIESV